MGLYLVDTILNGVLIVLKVIIDMYNTSGRLL